MLDQLEARVVFQMLDIAQATCEERVETNDSCTFFDQSVTEVRADESGSSANQCNPAFLISHALLPGS